MTEQKTIGLTVNKLEWSNFIGVDETTMQTAKKIEMLSSGLTPKQFTEAVSIALDFVSRYFILSSQSCQQSSEQG